MSRTFLLLSLLLLASCAPQSNVQPVAPSASSSSSIVAMQPEVHMGSAESSQESSRAKAILTSSQASSASSLSLEQQRRAKYTEAQYEILYEAGTEEPFTSPLLNEHRKGTYYSIDCDIPMFRSEQKFDSGTGWPSFWAPASPDAVVEVEDDSLGMTRTEIRSKCGGHLGHVFNDGPQPTGLRYCMNGLVLRFVPDPVQ